MLPEKSRRLNAHLERRGQSNFLRCYGKIFAAWVCGRGLTLPRLKAVCRKAKTSVPRNRVYSFYASRCASERVVPLNPASFGKLVRIIFPGIATRRLGVRGESKYHYVDLALVEDEQMGHVLETSAPNKGRTSSAQPSRQASVSNASMFPYAT